MKFGRAEPSRAYQAIVDQVCDAVMSGDLKVGDLLPPEREIAAQTGICRTSVREALKVLADAGLVMMKPGGGGGTRLVRDVLPSELLGHAFELSRKRMLDLFEVRNSLELTAAELAAARATPEHIRGFEDLVRQLEQLICERPEDADEFRTIDLRFHYLIMKASGNAALLSSYNAFTRQIALALEMVVLADIEAHALPTMISVVGAIRRRNPVEARLAMSAHVYPLIPIVEQFFEGAPAGQVRLGLASERRYAGEAACAELDGFVRWNVS
jgi:GntR family transcriptional regulator, transcriptional repressor for pyruvate dehydrogenase complex